MSKVIDKIITSVHEPDNTKVVWHNPETGELKIFGNTGWELAGGGKLPEIVESGWVLDKETGGIASKFIIEFPNTCSYQSRGQYAWVFDGNPGLVTGETYELTEVGTDNKVFVVCLGNPGGPWGGNSKAYAFEGNLDTSKVYSYGTYESSISNTVSGLGSVASGNECIASGTYSHAEGRDTTTSGTCSHSEGQNTIASGESSHAEGECTTASSISQHVQGRYNIDDPDNIYQFIIGNGERGSLSNAFAVKWDGTIVLWKDVDTPLELTPSKLEKLLALVD